MKLHLKGNIESNQVWLNDNLLCPSKSQEIINHSPDGFSWGYGGSGPAQLSLAILLEVMSKEDACKNYQQFKWDVIAKLPQTDFEIEIEL